MRHRSKEHTAWTQDSRDEAVVRGEKRNRVGMRLSRPGLSLAALSCAVSLVLAGCDPTTAPGPGGSVEAWAARHSAAIVVMGTGDPAIDIPAVQSGVDQGGTVILKGHFSFTGTPTQAVAPLLVTGGYPAAAEVLVSKAVSIVGEGDEDDEMTTIEGGTIPFYVDAPGQEVTISRLRFVRPTSDAILVHAASGLDLAFNRVEGLVPFAGVSEGIGINTSGAPPTPSSPGDPQNVSGTVLIQHNHIDATGGTAQDNTLGITIFSVGVTGAEVEVHVVGNRISNTTETAINLRRVGGRADIEGNVIRTGSVAGGAARDQAIRVANLGTYRISNNRIDCGWVNADAEGIGVFSQFADWPIEGATVEHNEVSMTAPEGTVFGNFSAGIAVFGFAQQNVVRHNTLRGRAGAGVAIPVFPLPPKAPAAPQDNAFLRNRFEDFVPSVADFFVGEHALHTLIVGPGTVVDLGDGTILRQ